jgi:DNA polymerase elongation subunit (family B)
MNILENLTDEELYTLEKMLDDIRPESYDNSFIFKNKTTPKIEGYSLTANGCLYKNDSHGFATALMQKMFDDRSKYKKLMIETKKRYEKTKSKEDEKLVSRYNNLQMAKKIQLNSFYGALSNMYFRWFNFDNAESITSSGQLTIKFIINKMNQFMNKICKTENVDYVIASDTDSIYVTLEKFVDQYAVYKGFNGHIRETDEIQIVKMIDFFCEKKIQPYLDICYDELAGMMNAYQQKMQMKRETIANKGIWRGKKMYILNAWNVEGVQYDKPKLKLSGIEAVRSSTPHACRENIKKALSIIMNEDQASLQKFIEEFRNEFASLPFQDVAFPRGLKGINKYKDSADIYKKGTPIQVKGALLFNNMLKKHNITNIPPLSDGDKIRFAYLKIPNPVQDTVIATSDLLPEQFNLDKYIDRDMQFNKSFLEPLKSITEVIGWEAEQRSTLEDFFG